MCYNPIRCIIPSYMLKKLAESSDKMLRESAKEDIKQSKIVRKQRRSARPSNEQRLAKAEAAAQRKLRLVYDTHRTTILPGRLVRAEGQGKTGNIAVDEAYNYSGYTYDFFWNIFERSSLDGVGMPLISTVHYFEEYDNAFWDGTQMVYGDGDGKIFRRFTASLDIVAHELMHGVISYTCNLDYDHQPGALNEHFADVFGVLVKHWKKDWTVAEADAKDGWLIGKEIVVQAPGRKALRSMSAPGTAYVNDADLGSDEQPWHMDNYYHGEDDEGGVHVNSGIPNHAFYLTCKRLKGKSWTRAGRIWWDAMLKLNQRSNFRFCAEKTYEVADKLYPGNKSVRAAVKESWKDVGIHI